MEPASPDAVIRFWLGAPSDPPLARSARWWTKDAAFDREVRERFEAVMEAGVRGDLAPWRTTPEGRLALVVLFDQLSRNMFRGTPRAFAQDPLARDLALAAFEAGDDRLHSTVAVGFLLMPFEHAEDLALQRRAVAGFEKLAAEAEPELREYLASQLDYARRHLAIIERFGRFPHRNGILGRPSTGDEIAFLKEPGSSF
jgi:uncharacterized protein (DUF924 family)